MAGLNEAQLPRARSKDERLQLERAIRQVELEAAARWKENTHRQAVTQYRARQAPRIRRWIRSVPHSVE